MYSQNTKTEDGEINILENIFPTIEISNAMFDENFTSKKRLDGNVG
jgi:hypothetical protein